MKIEQRLVPVCELFYEGMTERQFGKMMSVYRKITSHCRDRLELIGTP